MCPSGATCLSMDCCFSEWASSIKIQLSMLVYYKANFNIISLKIHLFSPWYSWKIAELVFSNNHSLTLIRVKGCEHVIEPTSEVFHFVCISDWSCQEVPLPDYARKNNLYTFFCTSGWYRLLESLASLSPVLVTSVWMLTISCIILMMMMGRLYHIRCSGCKSIFQVLTALVAAVLSQFGCWYSDRGDSHMWAVVHLMRWLHSIRH